MMETAKKSFDVYAADYDAALARGLAVSGEDKNFFAVSRIEWLRDCISQFSPPLQWIMDYGCGTGSSSPFLLNLLGADYLIGTDYSLRSLEIARREHGSERAQFLLIDSYQPCAHLDLVFCNGVFHHIPQPQRNAAVGYIFRSLRPGGFLAFWENNPWNPGTRYVMSRIPFDRNALTLSAPEARRLLESAGFKVLRTDFLFIFPRFLRCLRFTERFCSGLPLGAQYQILCRKPCA